jgi:solute carrier family 25 carnitine/acylcarnitine transporter 20/29
MSTNNENKNKDYSLYSVFRSLDFKQELIYGSIAGIAISIVGHPFDTVKTCIQTYQTPLIKTIKSIYSNHGFVGFYRGIASPLTTSAFINAIVFGVYECSRTLMSHHYNLPFDDYRVIVFSAAFAGFANSFFIGPIELFKIKLQIETQSLNHSKYGDILRNIYRTGGRLGLFQGLAASMIRDCISYPFQFLSYMISLKYLRSRRESNTNLLHDYIIGGAIGGFFCWTSTYPIDTAKTVIQAKELNSKLKIRFTGQLISTLKDIYRRQGLSGLFAGYTACLGRALLANACGFLAWETSKKILKY